MQDDVLKSIDTKMGTLVRLMAWQFIQGKSQKDAVITLNSLGLDANTIAQIVDTKPNVVYARLSEIRKKSKKTTKESGAK